MQHLGIGPQHGGIRLGHSACKASAQSLEHHPRSPLGNFEGTGQLTCWDRTQSHALKASAFSTTRGTSRDLSSLRELKWRAQNCLISRFHLPSKAALLSHTPNQPLKSCRWTQTRETDPSGEVPRLVLEGGELQVPHTHQRVSQTLLQDYRVPHS